MSTITNLASSFKGIQNIAKAMLELKALDEVPAHVAELQAIAGTAQGLVLSLQSDYSALTVRIAELENELAELK
ncbi:MAG: hypothetical protein ABIV42_03885 [Nitrosospira sp.]